MALAIQANRQNKAVQLDSSHYLSGAAMTVGSGALTLEFWLKWISGSDTDIVFSNRNGSSTAYWMFDSKGEAGNSLRARFKNSAGTIIQAYPAAGKDHTDGDWHHIGMSRDASGNFYCYFDDTAGAKATGANITPDSDGFNFNYDGYYGSIANTIQVANVCVWNTFKTLQEFINLGSRRPRGDESDLVRFWPIDEGTGTTATDRSANSNNGTATNGTGWVSGPPISGSGN